MKKICFLMMALCLFPTMALMSGCRSKELTPEDVKAKTTDNKKTNDIKKEKFGKLKSIMERKGISIGDAVEEAAKENLEGNEYKRIVRNLAVHMANKGGHMHKDCVYDGNKKSYFIADPEFGVNDKKKQTDLAKEIVKYVLGLKVEKCIIVSHEDGCRFEIIASLRGHDIKGLNKKVGVFRGKNVDETETIIVRLLIKLVDLTRNSVLSKKDGYSPNYGWVFLSLHPWDQFDTKAEPLLKKEDRVK